MHESRAQTHRQEQGLKHR
uniref:Uncharacterized protein n=1 Tax=Anguilla anguilla TaxID=7936 RepID=A0A0E9UJN8_ANGAN